MYPRAIYFASGLIILCQVEDDITVEYLPKFLTVYNPVTVKPTHGQAFGFMGDIFEEKYKLRAAFDVSDSKSGVTLATTAIEAITPIAAHIQPQYQSFLSAREGYLQYRIEHEDSMMRDDAIDDLLLGLSTSEIPSATILDDEDDMEDFYP